MTDHIDFFLRFPDAASALAAAQALGFAGDDATELASDGWWHPPAVDTVEIDDLGNPIVSQPEPFYFAIDVVFGTGEIWRNVGTEEEPVMEKIPGFHINGRFFGPPEAVPDFGEALIMPDNPSCRFA